MKKRLRWRLVITIVLLLIASAGMFFCYTAHLFPYGELAPELMSTAQYLEQNPLPRPAVFGSVDTHPDQFRNLCFTLILYPPTPHLTASEEASHSIAIDGHSARIDAAFGTGSHGSYCVYAGNLSVGLHIASAEATTRDGVEHT